MIRSESVDPIYRFVRNGKVGFIDQTGKVVIKPAVETSRNGGHEFHAGLMEIGGSEGIYADRTGKGVLDTGFYRGWDFSEGLADAMRKQGEKCGIIDRTGKFVISPRFESYPKGLPDFSYEGLARIEVSVKEGYVGHDSFGLVEKIDPGKLAVAAQTVSSQNDYRRLPHFACTHPRRPNAERHRRSSGSRA